MKRKISLWVLLLIVLSLILTAIYTFVHKTDFQTEYTLEEHLLLDKEICDDFNGISHKKDGFVVNSKNDTISFGNFLSTLRSPIMILRFSSFSCPPCVEFLLEKTTEFMKEKSGVTKLMLIADIPVNDLHVLQKDFDEFKLYKTSSMSTDFDMALTPYLYFIDENLKVQNYHIPRKEVPDETDAYFSRVTKWLNECQ